MWAKVLGYKIADVPTVKFNPGFNWKNNLKTIKQINNIFEMKAVDSNYVYETASVFTGVGKNTF